MRDIAHGFFAASPAMAGPLVALVLFFLVFVAITRRVVRSRDADWKDEASLPLSDGHARTQGSARGDES